MLRYRKFLAAVLCVLLAAGQSVVPASAQVFVAYTGDSIFPASEFMPSQGDIRALVIPVQFSDITFSSDPSAALSDIFQGSDPSSVPSVSTYMKNASYGKLNLSFTIAQTVTLPGKRESYTDSWEILIDECLQAAVEAGTDLSLFDSNQDGTLDGLYFVWPGEAKYNSGWWPSSDTFYYGFSCQGYTIGSYTSLSYELLTQDVSLRQMTAIHETGHQLGLTDYYAGGSTPGTGADTMMDRNTGDEDPFSKLLLGWNKPITAQDGTWYVLSSASVTSDVLLLAPSGWDGNLLSEYFLVEYVTPQANQKDVCPYSSGAVRLWHVNAATSRFTNDITVDMYKYSNRPESSQKLLTMAVSGTQWYQSGEQVDLSGLWYSADGPSWTVRIGSMKNGQVSIWVSESGAEPDSEDPLSFVQESSTESSGTSGNVSADDSSAVNSSAADPDSSATDGDDSVSGGSSAVSDQSSAASSSDSSAAADSDSTGTSGSTDSQADGGESTAEESAADESKGSSGSELDHLSPAAVVGIAAFFVICFLLLKPSGKKRSSSRGRTGKSGKTRKTRK